MLEKFITFSFAGLPPGLISIIVISFIVTLFQTLVYKKLSDQKRIKELKERQKEIRKELKQATGKKLEELNKEILSLSAELMKLSLIPSIVTLLPLLLVLWFLKNSYTAVGIGNIISWGANLPIVGSGAGWLLSFIVFSIIFNILLRKLMKVY